MKTTFPWQPPDLPNWAFEVSYTHHKEIPETWGYAGGSPAEPAYVEVYDVRPLPLAEDLKVMLLACRDLAEDFGNAGLMESMKRIAEGPTKDDCEMLLLVLNDPGAFADDEAEVVYEQFHEHIGWPEEFAK